MTGAGFREEQTRIGAPGAADVLVEMVDVSTEYTGMAGTGFISMAMGPDGPQVKWSRGRPGRALPCPVATLETPPRALNVGLPALVAREGERLVRPWVEGNRDALLRCWREGTSWDVDEVRDFVADLDRMA